MKFLAVVLTALLVSCAYQEVQPEKPKPRVETNETIVTNQEPRNDVTAEEVTNPEMKDGKSIYGWAETFYAWHSSQNSCRFYATLDDTTICANFVIYNYDKETLQSSKGWTYEQIQLLLKTNDLSANTVGKMFEEAYIRKVNEILDGLENGRP